ncbi:hypothetical protein CPB84DRAFT_1744470 [Gymnopilus junonius]|uniref:Uncharacterized protein n=1 Tax=Gymnopilus junonius TaxID=109634 RepID=A0A9P5NVN0_GYMJU|nr:hypothetical protein CPB84DRAFT_1744470 [Gymnopilus junonius]
MDAYNQKLTTGLQKASEAGFWTPAQPHQDVNSATGNFSPKSYHHQMKDDFTESSYSVSHSQPRRHPNLNDTPNEDAFQQDRHQLLPYPQVRQRQCKETFKRRRKEGRKEAVYIDEGLRGEFQNAAGSKVRK